MHDIRRQDVSAWYELDVEGTNLVIHIYDRAMSRIKNGWTNESPLVVDYQTNFDFPTFIPPTAYKWGFGEVFHQFPPVRDGWVSWRCQLPKIGIESKKPDWLSAYAVAASLDVLFCGLRIFEEETGYIRPQLIAITGMVVRKTDFHGGAIYASLSPTLCRWIIAQGQIEQRTDVNQEMLKAFRHMTGWKVDRFLEHQFETRIYQPRALHLTCPGNACGLDPEDYFRNRPEEGYELWPHNTDGPLQQLTLLTGLAKIHSVARKEGF